MFRRFRIIVCAACLLLPAFASSQEIPNHVLVLDGEEDGAQLANDMITPLDECTIEAWMRWDAFNRFAQPWSFGTASSCIGINTLSSSPDLQFFAYEKTGVLHVARAPQSVELHQWYHLAAVINNSEGLQLYMNGVLIANSQQGIGKAGAIAGSGPAWAGVSPWEENGHFIGALDELRIWNHVRSPQQIQSGMLVRASGSEEGLVGLWNFDGQPQNPGSTVRRTAVLAGHAERLPLPWDTLTQSQPPFVIRGWVGDEAGTPLPNANIAIQSSQGVLNRTLSDSSGQYAIVSSKSIPLDESLEIVATHLTRGTRLQLDMDAIRKQVTVQQDLVLSPAVHLEGSVFTLNHSPFPHVLVEALAGDGGEHASIENKRFTTWTDARGNYRFVNLPRQPYRLRVHLPHAWMGLKRTFNEATGTVPETIPYDPEDVSVLDTTQVESYRHLDFHIPSFRKARTTTFDLLSHLNEIEIRCMEFDHYGRLWVGLEKGGLAVSSNGHFKHVPSSLLGPDRILSLHHDGERLWIGTEKGLFWQTGFEFNITQTTALEALKDQEIWCFYQDEHNRIWIGSLNGLYTFENQSLHRIEAFDKKWIKDVITKNDGTVWVSTWGNGLFEASNEGWIQLGLHEGLVHQYISTLAKRQNGEIWVGTDGGLSIYSPENDTFRNETNHSVLPDPYITDIVEDDEGVVWVATKGAGLLRFDDGRWTNWEQSLNIPHQWITACLLDPSGDLWLGTQSGLSLFDYKHLKVFDHHDGLSHSLMLDLDGNDQGEIWIGTQGMGVIYFDGSGFTNLSKDAGLPHEHIYTIEVVEQTGQTWAGGVVGISELVGSTIVETYLDSSGPEGEMTEIRDLKSGQDGRLWLVSHKSGLAHFFPADRSLKTFGSDQGLGDAHALCLDIPQPNSIWVGTDRGLYFFDGSRFSMPDSLEPLANERIEDVEWDPSHDRLWIVSRNGIFQYHPLTSTLERVSPEDNGLLERGNQICISSNSQRCWVGLLGGGMAIFNGKQWSSLDHRDGLPHNTVRTVFEDRSGMVWAGTDAGIFRLIPQIRTPRLSLQLTTEVGSRLYQSGESPAEPFQVLANRRLTMDYTLINMAGSQSKRQYQYRILPSMNGNTNWVTLTSNSMDDVHLATPGNYQLEYKAFDGELNESELQSIDLHVLREDHFAPWYRKSEFTTLAAFILVALLFIVVGLLAKYYKHKRRMFRERERHMMQLEHKNTELELAKDEALRALQVKSDFLSTVSHEIRTPMNGMLGMNYLLLNSQLDEEQRDYAETIKHCGEVLLQTINNILDLSKMEAGKLKLHHHRFHFRQSVEDALKVTEGNAKKKELSLKTDFAPSVPEYVVGDAQRLSQIIINLVGNSIKFTPKGTITIRTQLIHEIRSTCRLRIEIEDPGIGVPGKLKDQLFEPFTQADSSESREFGGSGLGLSICKRLVQSMGGEIGYHPAAEKGSVFWIEIELEKPV